jgi:hypothetical protein
MKITGINFRCRENFKIEVTEQNASLRITYSEKVYDNTEFCLTFNEDLQIVPEICVELKNDQKFK